MYSFLHLFVWYFVLDCDLCVHHSRTCCPVYNVITVPYAHSWRYGRKMKKKERMNVLGMCSRLCSFPTNKRLQHWFALRLLNRHVTCHVNGGTWFCQTLLRFRHVVGDTQIYVCTPKVSGFSQLHLNGQCDTNSAAHSRGPSHKEISDKMWLLILH
jgi:hypothetical protein